MHSKMPENQQIALNLNFVAILLTEQHINNSVLTERNLRQNQNQAQLAEG